MTITGYLFKAVHLEIPDREQHLVVATETNVLMVGMHPTGVLLYLSNTQKKFGSKSLYFIHIPKEFSNISSKV